MRLDLTFACGLYDRTLALQNGSVAPEGINLNFVVLNPGELFRRQARNAEFDVSEFSLATMAHLVDQGDRRLVAIPAFPSRKFRHSEIYVSKQAGIHRPEDMSGKRVGAQGWQATATVWQRAMLAHDYGVTQDQMEWYFGGYDEPTPGFSHRVPLDLPDNVLTKGISDQQSLGEMLEHGEIDALFGTWPPRCIREGSNRVDRLFPNYRKVETDYYRRTGIFPIMHTVVIKREIYEKAPWSTMSLYKACLRAKAEALRRMPQAGALFTMLPWAGHEWRETQTLMGPDPFVYGLEPNRKLLETFLGYCLEQGIIKKPLAAEDLFAPETHNDPEEEAMY